MKNWAIVFLISSLLSALGLAQEQHAAPPAEHGAPAAAPAAGAHEGGEHGSTPAATEHAAAGHHASAEHHDQGDPMILWKWINFGILAAGLGILAGKNLPVFFTGRTAEIQQGIAEAQKLKSESDAKAAAMEARMAKLGAEIEALRTQGKAELAAEGDRIRKETEASAAKLQAHAEAEIESIAKAAKQDLKNYSVQLAVNLAEEKIRSRSGVEGKLFDRFIADLETKGAKN